MQNLTKNTGKPSKGQRLQWASLAGNSMPSLDYAAVKSREISSADIKKRQQSLSEGKVTLLVP